MMMILAASLGLMFDAEPKAMNLFTDHMVLQRQKPIPVFGTGAPGSEVVVELNGEKAKTKVDSKGRWLVKLPAMSAGGPYELSVNGAIAARDVLIGEVWIASGQSNMEWPVAASPRDITVARQSTKPEIRMFTISKSSVPSPAVDVLGQWQIATPATVGGFSGVGFWFAESIYRQLGVPIGIINTSWGGTPAESWMSWEALKATPSIKRRVTEHEKMMSVDNENALATYKKQQAEYEAAIADPGISAEAKNWAETDYSDADWKTVTVPVPIESIEGKAWDGAFWFRKEIVVPTGGKAFLSLGAIDDFDQTFVNGKLVGKTGIETTNHWSHPRRYEIPAGILKPGRNVIAVRGYDTGGAGGFTGPAAQMFLEMPGQPAVAPLAGSWKYRKEREIPPVTAPTPPLGIGNPWSLASLYNGMISPIVPYGLRGAIWYQGESNADRAEQYATVFPNMIKDWRKRFGQGDFPFYYVQLANYMKDSPEPADYGWAELRDAQDRTRSLKNAELATILDIGESDDIHPQNKRDVGYRLARIALARDYDLPVVYSGPRPRLIKATGDSIRVEYATGIALRTSDGKAPRAFAIAGADGKFAWAEAQIDGESVVLTSAAVPAPKFVRYAWSNNPMVNLINSEGLPAVPFRTDKKPYTTANNN